MKKFLAIAQFSLFILLILNNFILLVVEPHVSSSLRGKAEDEKPYYFENNAQYWGDLSDYAVCGDCLYMLYDMKNILKCYDLYGNYMHSFYLTDFKNGEASLLRVGDLLYLVSKKHDLLQFSNGIFQRFLDSDADRDEILSITEMQSTITEKRTSGDGSTFTMKGASIWKTDADGNQICIVYRPRFFLIFQGDLEIGLSAIYLILLLILQRIGKIYS